MNSVSDTDRLIRKLAHEAGTGQDRAAFSFEGVLLLVTILSLAVAVTGVLLMFGIRPDLVAYVQGAPFHFKIASTLALACGSFVLVRYAGRPGNGGLLPLLALFPALAVLVVGAVTDVSGLPVMGRSSLSVPICVGTIVVISLPALAMIIGALRIGATTRPAIAGATAGLLAGALASAAYTLACQNDGRMHVAIWYGAGILIVAGLGAAVGRRTLTW
jgi:hypothetical protein